MIQARQGMNQHSNLYSGQVQQHGQNSYYSNTQSPSSALQQVTSNSVYSSCLHRVVLLISLCPVPPGNCPSAQLPAVPSKLWLRWSPAPPGAPAHAPPGPAHHQQTAPCFPAVQRHNGPQPQHDAAPHQQGVLMCGSD